MVNGCLPQSRITFPCKICNKNVNDNNHVIQCDIVTFGSTLNVTILIILIINICKVTIILGIVLLAQAQYFLLIA